MWVVRHFLNNSPFPDPGEDSNYITVCDPCAGAGNLLKAVKESYPNTELYGVDIQEQYAKPLQELGAQVEIKDFRELRSMFDTVIANPPFTLAFEVMQWAVKHATQVALLGRVGLVETKERSLWIEEKGWDLYILPNRPSFRGKGTDSTQYAWWVYPGNWSYTILPWLSLQERKELDR